MRLPCGDHARDARLDHLGPSGESGDPVRGDVSKGDDVVELEKQFVHPDVGAVLGDSDMGEPALVVGVVLEDPYPPDKPGSHLFLHLGVRHAPVGSEGDQYRRVLDLDAARGQLLQDERKHAGRGGVACVVVDEQQSGFPPLDHILQPGGGDRLGQSPPYFVKIRSRRGRRGPWGEHRQKILVGNHHIAETVVGKGDSRHGAPPSRCVRGRNVVQRRFRSGRRALPERKGVVSPGKTISRKVFTCLIILPFRPFMRTGEERNLR